MLKQRDFSSFKDILKARYDESDFMWVSRDICFKKAYNQDHDTSNPLRLQQEVLYSPRIQKLIDELSKDSSMSKEKLSCSVKEILQEIGHTRQVPVIRWLGYFLLKILKKTLTGLYVNEEKLMQIKRDMGRNPVVFLPSHRSYADFILMAFVMFNYDIEVPCVAAGMDFQSMWLMGRMLRDCNAFFMRRSFADDKVYKTVFDEYVKHIVTRGDAPIEFFIEGTRSRSGKSLMPKFGLLTMVLDAFFSGQVPDITIIPVNISYDRTLEEVLFAYELLGIAKPKESTSGLIKGIQILDERYGNVFMDFCDPISLRAYVSEMSGGLLKYTIRVPDREQRQIVDLAHHIVDRQQKYSVLSCFNVLALVLSNHVTVGNTALPLAQTTKDVAWLSSILGLMGALVQVNKNVAECVSETLRIHKSLVRLNEDSEIQLVSVHTPDVRINPDRLKGYALRDDTMSMAVPLFMLQQYVNPCLHFLVGPAVITVIMQCLGEIGHIVKDDLFRKYQFLCSLLCHEFVLYKTWEVNDFEESLRQLELVNIIESSTAAHLTLGNHRKLQMLFCNLLYPFLSGYLSLCQFLLQVGDVTVSEKELLRSAQRKVEEDLLNGVITHHYSLSLDTMTACLASLTAMDALTRSRIRGEYVYKVNETNLVAVVSELEKLDLRPQPYKDPFELSSKHSLLITPSNRAKL